MVGFQSISVATLQTATPEAVVTWMFVVSRAAKIANSSLRSGPLLFVHDKPGLVRESLFGFLAGAFENKVGGASALTRGGNLDQLLLPRRRAQTESPLVRFYGSVARPMAVSSTIVRTMCVRLNGKIGTLHAAQARFL